MSAPGQARRRIVLVGGGHAHALLLLQWALRPLPGIDLQLVSPEPVSLYSGMLPGWLAGRWREEDLQIDLQPLCRAAGARLLVDEALALEPQARRLHLARGGTLPYDLLSINTGSTLNAPEHAGAVLALRPLSSLVQRWPALLQAWRTGEGPQCIDMVGGGAAGVEVLLAVLARLRAMRPERCLQARLFSSAARLLPGHNAGVARRAAVALRAAGVELLCARRWLAGDSPAGSWLLWAAGARPPAWLAASGLQRSDEGYVAVDASLRSRSHPEVFAAGDSAAFRPALDKSGVRAVRMAPVLAHNLLATLLGQPLQPYRPQASVLALLALPEGRAIASRGSWLAAEGRWVARWKDRLDLDFMQRFAPGALAALSPQNPNDPPCP